MERIPALTRAQLAELDRRASEEYGLPGAVLMENAGRGAAEHVLALLAARHGRGQSAARVAVLCGPGNNGGDGCVVARHLANAGIAVEIFATHALEDLKGDAAIMRRAAEKMGVPIHDVASAEAFEAARSLLARGDVFVDGLLGTGFRGEVRPAIARIIQVVNDLRANRGVGVVALDLPSGLDCDTGRPSGATVRADLTVTFAAPKVGFEAAIARPFLGSVVVATIGAPAVLVERVRGARPATGLPSRPGNGGLTRE